jgi:hypothetical protein
MVGASGFEIRPERVCESLQITSGMPTSRYQSGQLPRTRFWITNGMVRRLYPAISWDIRMKGGGVPWSYTR